MIGKWEQILRSEFDKDYMKFIARELTRTKDLCPAAEDIFNAYKLTAPEDVKVVILGQDPYPTAGMAHGLSFSTLGTKLPASLRVIFDELVDSGISSKRRTNYNLTDWAEQGVLMLNTILTTNKGSALAHSTWGWQNFTSKTLEYLKLSQQPVVFLLWGKAAFNTYRAIVNGQNNFELVSCHPAAQLYGGANKFVGNKHFVRTNEILVENNLSPIVWDGK